MPSGQGEGVTFGSPRVLTGGDGRNRVPAGAREPSFASRNDGRSGVNPEPTVQSGWEKVVRIDTCWSSFFLPIQRGESAPRPIP